MFNILYVSYTVEYRYNTVQFITILHKTLRWHQENINQNENFEDNDSVITALHCIWLFSVSRTFM